MHMCLHHVDFGWRVSPNRGACDLHSPQRTGGFLAHHSVVQVTVESLSLRKPRKKKL